MKIRFGWFNHRPSFEASFAGYSISICRKIRLRSVTDIANVWCGWFGSRNRYWYWNLY